MQLNVTAILVSVQVVVTKARKLGPGANPAVCDNHQDIVVPVSAMQASLKRSGAYPVRKNKRQSPPPVPALVQWALDILPESQSIVKIPVKRKMASEKFSGANPVNPKFNRLKCVVRCSKKELLWASAK
jgi:hypothetical protein